MADEERPRERLEPALRALEERLARASESAERLLAEAVSAAAARAPGGDARGGEPAHAPEPATGPSGAGAGAGAGAAGVGEDAPRETPAAGWAAAGGGARASAIDELEPLVELLRSLREFVPPELERRVAEALRDLLLAVRALIDWYLERVEQRRAHPVEVEDIPIV